MGMKRIVRGLGKTKERLFAPLRKIFSSGTLDENAARDLEDLLFSADLGVEATERIIEKVKEKQRAQGSGAEDFLKVINDELMSEIEDVPPYTIPEGSPRVIVMTGVNGVGKTSTIGKLASRFKADGEDVLLAACDTFRAAAIEQLELWAKKTGSPIVRQEMGSDPAAVAFDAVNSAIAKGIGTVIIDTAGRLHTKSNLMEELKKIFRVIGSRMPEAAVEAWLVIDANSGQNSIRQAEVFVEALPVTALILTKLDSTAKGGAVIPIQRDLRVPVLFTGVGEGVLDLEPFDSQSFISALLSE
ncbi:MAG: signal recognition particle-docking protein FtsY [Candidatus Krumholzibacteriota bacterium]|nr:signal recognition particle-docking protein FtsY [Candidatus Krumholzibacteriota bacterium]